VPPMMRIRFTRPFYGSEWTSEPLLCITLIGGKTATEMLEGILELVRFGENFPRVALPSRSGRF
jgi:hypothetical protein